MPKPPHRERTPTLRGALGLTALAGGITVLGATALAGIDPDLRSAFPPSSQSSPHRPENHPSEEPAPSEAPQAPVGLTVAPAEFVPATPGPDGEYTPVADPDPDGEYTTVHVTVANRSDGELDVSPSHFVLKGVSGSRYESSGTAGATEDRISTLTLLPHQRTSGTVSAPGSFTPDTVVLLDEPHGEPVREASVHP